MQRADTSARPAGKRLAIVISHPIQYYAPLYQRLARRTDLTVKVFFTWHAGREAAPDHGFKQPVAWDIALTEGYEFEQVPNTSSDPGMHHFRGLQNPTLVKRVLAWNPDAVHLTGWAWLSHLLALWAFYRLGVPVLFRGDSHLLDTTRHGPAWWVKQALLRRVFSWPQAFLYVGTANRAYYEAFGVAPERLFQCPHSIDVGRFAEPAAAFERDAAQWRRQLHIGDERTVVLFAGKFERKKRPLELMRAVQGGDRRFVLVLAGAGELEDEIRSLARAEPDRFRVLPFQNQSRMPIVYRLGEVVILPSAFGETWGLAVNEAMACGRPVLVSDRVGCAADVVDDSCGRVFPWADTSAMMQYLNEMTVDRVKLAGMGRSAAQRARSYDFPGTETALVDCMRKIGVP